MSLVRQILLDSPAGYWPLDETSGTTAFDRSGNGRDGTYNSTYTLNQAMGPLRGVDLTGGYVSVADDAAFSSHAGSSGVMTIEAWSVWDTASSTMALFTKGNSSNYEWEMGVKFLDATAFNLTMWDLPATHGAGASSATGALATGRLYQVVGVLDRPNSLVMLYVNGALAASATPQSFLSSDGTAAVRIGGRADGGDPAHDGRVSNVAYFGSALSATRIKVHYEAGIRAGVSV